MKKCISIVLLTVLFLTILPPAQAESKSPVGIWGLAYGKSKCENFLYIELLANGNGTMTLVSSWYASICTIKWSLSGQTVKYKVISNNKGFSSLGFPVEYETKDKLTFKNGILYCSGKAMSKIPRVK